MILLVPEEMVQYNDEQTLVRHGFACLAWGAELEEVDLFLEIIGILFACQTL